MTDLPFIDYAFKTFGATTARTMPDRLAEVKNVKDFGAIGNGTTVDTAAIQAAVDWTSGANRGTIYFPEGGYLIDAPITLNYDGNLSICFRGEIGSSISGNFDGFLFDRSLGTPNNTPGGRIFERLSMQNSHATGGCIRLGSTIGGAIRDCVLASHINITTEDSVGASSTNVSIQNCQFTLGSGTESGSHHVIIGGGGVIEGCGFVGSDTGVRVYGFGLHCSGNRSERNNTAWLLGVDSGDNPVGLSGFSGIGSTYEGNGTAVDFVGPVDGFFLGGQYIMGHDPGNAGVSGVGSQYGIRIRAGMATNGVISGCISSSWFDQAGFSIANASSRTNVVISNCQSTQTGSTGDNWTLPTNAYTAFFENNNIQPLWTYSQLPSGAGNVFEGDEFDISDGTDGLAWGATATNTGSHTTHYLVRWNGSNWTVVGK